MKLDEQNKKLVELKKVINSKLNNLDFNRIKELLLWLAGSKEYQKLKDKDNQLLDLEFIGDVWLEEKKSINAFEMQGDAFEGVSSLEDIETRYLKAQFLMYRIENNIPFEYCIGGVQEIIKNNYSSYFLFRIIVRETEQIEQNILKLSKLLKNQNDLVKVIGLLNKGVEKFPEGTDLLLELADCWFLVQKYDKAFECLKKIKKPSKEVIDMIMELEKVLKDEGI